MGATTSKPPKKSSTFSRFASVNKRASKRILLQRSAIYPSNLPCNKTSENNEHNNNSLKSIETDEATVVIRNKGGISDESVHSLIPKNYKKEKKKRKPDTSPSGDDTISTYHQTNVCYYMVENGKFLKLPNDTKHKSNDGCYVKLSNGSFRHLMVPDGAGSHQNINFKPKDVRQSMPTQKTSEKYRERNEEKQPQNRKIMVTMVEGGLPVLAVSKREKTPVAKKEKDQVKVKVNVNEPFESIIDH